MEEEIDYFLHEEELKEWEEQEEFEEEEQEQEEEVKAKKIGMAKVKNLSRLDLDSLWTILSFSKDLQTIQKLCRLNKVFSKNYCGNETRWKMLVETQYPHRIGMKTEENTWKSIYFTLVSLESWHSRAKLFLDVITDILERDKDKHSWKIKGPHSDRDKNYPMALYGPSSDESERILNRKNVYFSFSYLPSLPEIKGTWKIEHGQLYMYDPEGRLIKDLPTTIGLYDNIMAANIVDTLRKRFGKYIKDILMEVYETGASKYIIPATRILKISLI